MPQSATALDVPLDQPFRRDPDAGDLAVRVHESGFARLQSPGFPFAAPGNRYFRVLGRGYDVNWPL